MRSHGSRRARTPASLGIGTWLTPHARTTRRFAPGVVPPPGSVPSDAERSGTVLSPSSNATSASRSAPVPGVSVRLTGVGVPAPATTVQSRSPMPPKPSSVEACSERLCACSAGWPSNTSICEPIAPAPTKPEPVFSHAPKLADGHRW